MSTLWPMIKNLDYPTLDALASRVGTPFYLYDEATLAKRLDLLRDLVDGPGLRARYAMKANSARRVLREIAGRGLWIDAVSGNEALRALSAGFPGGGDPPRVLLTSDVFRDNALNVILETGVLPNIGSPGQVAQLARAGYRGSLGLRLNPGFGHGHTWSCDTGGPSSKHGVWFEDAAQTAKRAAQAGLPVVLLHAHVGTGPNPAEFAVNMARLVEFFAKALPAFPDARAVNLGGGLPFSYLPGVPQPDLAEFRRLLRDAPVQLAKAAGREVRVEIEPGRFVAAPAGVLVARVTDIKRTGANSKGPAQVFVMVDAGFNDMVRSAMYGAYHHLSVVPREAPGPETDCCVAGPLCESGDVFTQESGERLAPRCLPLPREGDFMVVHDTGAYGASMSSRYNSLGCAPQLWRDASGAYMVISRRETIEDIIAAECEETL